MAQTRSQFNGSVPPRRYADILERLTALEAELADASKGTGLPADPQLTQLVTQSLVNNYPHADIQIVVSSSRKSTTTKQCYETETPGMVGLDTEKLRELQKQLMEKISLPGFDTKAPKTNGNDAKNGMSHEVSSDPVQHKSSVEEVFADEDGTQVISKKLTRIVTTSHSAISGIGNDQNDGKYGSEKSDDSSTVASIGSVRDRIAIFESLKDATHPGQKIHEEQKIKHTDDAREKIDDSREVQPDIESSGTKISQECIALKDENVSFDSPTNTVPPFQESGAYYAITRKHDGTEPSSTERTEESNDHTSPQFESTSKPEKSSEFNNIEEIIPLKNRFQEEEEQITSNSEQSQPVKYAELRSTTLEEPLLRKSEEEKIIRQHETYTSSKPETNDHVQEFELREESTSTPVTLHEQLDSKLIETYEERIADSKEPTDMVVSHDEHIISTPESTTQETFDQIDDKTIYSENSKEVTAQRGDENTNAPKPYAEKIMPEIDQECTTTSHELTEEIIEVSDELNPAGLKMEDPERQDKEDVDVPRMWCATQTTYVPELQQPEVTETEEIFNAPNTCEYELTTTSSDSITENKNQTYENDIEDPVKAGEPTTVIKDKLDETTESQEKANPPTTNSLNYDPEFFFQKLPEHDSMPNIHATAETDKYSFSINHPSITEIIEPESMSADDNQHIKEVSKESVKNEPEPYSGLTETTTISCMETTSENTPSAQKEEARFLSDVVGNDVESVHTKEIDMQDSLQFKEPCNNENICIEQINQAKQTTAAISRQSSGIVESDSYPEIQNHKADERELHDIPKIPHLIVEEEASNKSDEEEEENIPYEHPLPRYQQKRNQARQDSSASIKTTTEQSEVLRDETPTPSSDKEERSDEFSISEVAQSRETENIIPQEITGVELDSQSMPQYSKSMSIQEHKPDINSELICSEQITRYDTKTEYVDKTNSFLMSSQEIEPTKCETETEMEPDLGDKMDETTRILQHNNEKFIENTNEIPEQMTDEFLFKSKDIDEDTYTPVTELPHSVSGGIVESESYDNMSQLEAKRQSTHSQNSVEQHLKLHEHNEAYDPHEVYHSDVAREITTITPREINDDNTEYEIQHPLEDYEESVSGSNIEVVQQYTPTPSSSQDEEINENYNNEGRKQGNEFSQDVTYTGRNDNTSLDENVDRRLSITPPPSSKILNTTTEKIHDKENERTNITNTEPDPLHQSNSTEFSSLNDSFETSTTEATIIPARKDSLSISNNSNAEITCSGQEDMAQSMSRTTPILKNEEIVEEIFMPQTRSLSQQQHYEQLGMELQSRDEGQRSSLVPEEESPANVEEVLESESLIPKEHITVQQELEDEYDIINSEDLPEQLQDNRKIVEQNTNTPPRILTPEENMGITEDEPFEIEQDTKELDIVNQDEKQPNNFSPELKNYEAERNFQIHFENQPALREYNIEHEGEHIIELSPGETEEQILLEARRVLEEEQMLKDVDITPVKTLPNVVKQPTIVDSKSVEFSNLPETHIRTDEKETLHDVQNAQNEVLEQNSELMHSIPVNTHELQQAEETLNDIRKEETTTSCNIHEFPKKEGEENIAQRSVDKNLSYDKTISTPFKKEEDAIPMDPLPSSTVSKYEIRAADPDNGQQIEENTTDLMVESVYGKNFEDLDYAQNNIGQDKLSIESDEKHFEVIEEAELSDYEKQVPKAENSHIELNENMTENFDVINSEDIPKEDEQISTSKIFEDIIQSTAEELVGDVFANLETSPKTVKIKEELNPTFEQRFYPIVRENTEDLEYDGDENDAELELLYTENTGQATNNNNNNDQLTLMIKEEQFRPKSPIPPAALSMATKFNDEKVQSRGRTLEDTDDVFIDSPIEIVHIERIIDSPPPDNELLFEVPTTSSIDRPLEKLAKMKELPQLSHAKKDTYSLESPEEEREFVNPDQQNTKSCESLSDDNHSGSSSASSLKKRLHYEELVLAAAAVGDNISSEGSLQEFERIEQEVVNKKKREQIKSADGSPTKTYITDEEKVLLQQVGTTGSVTSLTEFENLEREIIRNAASNANEITDSALATAIAEQDDVMVLSDIREESEEAEEGKEHDDRMSTRDDDEDDDTGGDMDSLSEKPPQNTVSSEQTHNLKDIQNALQDVMLSSADSLELGLRQLGMETSADSLEPSYPLYDISNKKRSEDDDEKDSLLELASQATHSHNPSADTSHMTADTDTTFQEYQQEIDDDVIEKDEAIARSYPTTVTTFETTQMRDDGTTETIIRRVQTRITDPIHSRIRFTGTEDENRLRNIQQKSDGGQPVESVDEEGNITTIICHRTPQIN